MVGCQSSDRGSDGGYLREYTQHDAEHAATFYGVVATLAPPTIPAQKRAHLDATLWPRIANRARHESLRDLAIAYSVSYETIRTVVRRVNAAGCTRRAMAAD